MNDIILSVENVSKLYRLGTVGTGTFGGDVQRFWKTKILGQEDPFLKIGKKNDRTSKEIADFVWALQKINFEVKRGEVLGIVGKNGSGKSTLLKLLSRITSPTSGSIKSAGRMASLLEVGTGFHPELTGRENIFLNGAILGMTKKEIQTRFDEIVDFSGCSMYIDTPIKRYSSGMTVRLGFAVAAFLDPEILVVDEVLAVGDAEFQKKAIGKMKDLSDGGGRTVLFVSHNMDSVRSLCGSALELRNGTVFNKGETNLIVDEYLNNIDGMSLGFSRRSYSGTNEITVRNVGILSQVENVINYSKNEEIEIQVDFNEEIVLNSSTFVDIGLYDLNGLLISWVTSRKEMEDKRAKSVIFKLANLHLAAGRYKLNLYLERDKRVLDYVIDAYYFEVIIESPNILEPYKKPKYLFESKYSLEFS
jgi:lipopolysaccharide transport system ATP-binding protein